GRPKGMKILHLLHSFPPESRGGTETYVLTLARAQRAAGDDAVVLAGSESPAHARAPETIEGVPVSRLPPPARDPYPLDGLDPAARAGIERIVREGGFDVAHVHHWHN